MTTHAQTTRREQRGPPPIPKRLLTQEERVRTLIEQMLNEIRINDNTGFAERLEQLTTHINLTELAEEQDPRKVELILTKILEDMYKTHGRFQAPETTVANVVKEDNDQRSPYSYFVADVATQYEKDTLLDQIRQIDGVQELKCIATSTEGVIRIRVRIDTSKLNGNGRTPIEEKVAKMLLNFPLGKKNMWAQFELERSYIVELAYRINDIRKVVDHQEINWIRVGDIAQELDDAEQLRDMSDLPAEQTWRLFGSKRESLESDGRRSYGLTLRNGHDGSNYKESVNEDDYRLGTRRLILGDGMGGHADGEKANQFVLDEMDKREGVELIKAIEQVDLEFEKQEEMVKNGSGTTISVVEFSSDTPGTVEAANTGDSPIWMKTIGGWYVHLFEDHAMNNSGVPVYFEFNDLISNGWVVRGEEGQRFMYNPKTDEKKPLAELQTGSAIASAVMGVEGRLKIGRYTTPKQLGIVELTSDGMDHATDRHIETTDPVIHAERSARIVILNYHPTGKRDDATIVCANVLDEVKEIQEWQLFDCDHNKKVSTLEWFLHNYQHDARIARAALDAMEQIGHYKTEQKLVELSAPDTIQYAREKRREVLVRWIRLAAEGNEEALDSLEPDTKEYGSQIASELLDNLPRIAQHGELRAIRICRELRQHELDGQVDRLGQVERELVDILEGNITASIQSCTNENIEREIRRLIGIHLIGDTEYYQKMIYRKIKDATEKLVRTVEESTETSDQKTEKLRKVLWEVDGLPRDSAKVVTDGIERICEPLYLEQRGVFTERIGELVAQNENVRLGFENADGVIRYMEGSGLLEVTASNEQNHATLKRVNNKFETVKRGIEQEAVLRMAKAENEQTRQKGYNAIGRLHADGIADQDFGCDQLIQGVRREKGKTRELARKVARDIRAITTGQYLVGKQIDLVKDGLETTDGKIAGTGIAVSSVLHLASIPLGGSIVAVVIPAVSLVGVLGLGIWYIGRKGKQALK